MKCLFLTVFYLVFFGEDDNLFASKIPQSYKSIMPKIDVISFDEVERKYSALILISATMALCSEYTSNDISIIRSSNREGALFSKINDSVLWGHTEYFQPTKGELLSE